MDISIKNLLQTLQDMIDSDDFQYECESREGSDYVVCTSCHALIFWDNKTYQKHSDTCRFIKVRELLANISKGKVNASQTR
jgi:uncharacterized C2H2 Zn-finger protein